MQWGRRIDHHRPIRYAETRVLLEAPFMVTREADGTRARFVVTGNCPACGGLMTKEFSYGVGGTGTKGRFRGPPTTPPPVPSPVTLYCECGHLHPDKPTDAADDGCARYWLVDLKTP